MAGVCERHVLEESDHGVDVGPPLSIAQREFGLPRPLGCEEWGALAECTAYTGHCGRKRDAFTTVSNTVALRSATVAHTVVYHQTAPWTVVAADLLR
jgi:hypothetical protein